MIMTRVALIGAGFIGRNHFNQYEKMTGRAKVVAICDTEENRRTGDWSNVGGNIADAKGTKRDLGDVRPVADWHEVIEAADVDMVDICVPTYLHAEMAIAGLQAGKHVLCEKPMALTVEDCDRMLAAAKNAPGKFMIAQCIRFWPECVCVKELVQTKPFGLLKALHLRRQAATPDYTLNNWALDPALAGGAILDLHVHDIDYAIHMLGKPKAVHAQAYRKPNGAVDRVHALWDYGPDLVVQLEGTWDLPPAFGFNMGITAVFETAAVVFDLNTGKPLTIMKPDGSTETPKLLPNDGYFREIEYFLQCIDRNETPTVSTPRESRDAVAIAMAEKKSAETCAPVPIA
jgi:predicted dehydrogenase